MRTQLVNNLLTDLLQLVCRFVTTGVGVFTRVVLTACQSETFYYYDTEFLSIKGILF